MKRTSDAVLLSEPEAALLLGMTPSGVAYIHRSGRLSARWLGDRHYAIAEVQGLKVYRDAHPVTV